MALLSFFDDPFDYGVRPSRIMDQYFGTGLGDEDLLSPCLPRPRRHHHRRELCAPYHRNWRSLASHRDRGSTVSCDKDKFQVNLDVQQFAPEEVTVKVSGDNSITIEGKHEEKEDEHGYVSRHFVRRYTLPKGHDIEKVQSKLSSDGVLTITAPKESGDLLLDGREIPIALTGKPSQEAIKNNGECCNNRENCCKEAGDKDINQKKEVKTKKK